MGVQIPPLTLNVSVAKFGWNALVLGTNTLEENIVGSSPTTDTKLNAVA